MTTPTVPKLRAHRAAARAALVTANPLGAGARIFDGKALSDETTPYAVVHGYPTSEFDGPVSDPHADVHALVQVSCHGATHDEADGLADACLPILLDPSKYTIAGRSVDQPELRTYRGATKDPDTTRDRYSAHLIVAIRTSPS